MSLNLQSPVNLNLQINGTAVLAVHSGIIEICIRTANPLGLAVQGMYL